MILNPEFQDVYFASQDNEGLHYDLRYTTSDGRIKYIEVKSFDFDYFHLSKDEYDFGKANIEDYEIWLVQDEQNIIPIKDFYTNSKYIINSQEYLVHLEIIGN